MLRNQEILRSGRKFVPGMSNSKARRPNGIQIFWFKSIKNLHDPLAKHPQACLNTCFLQRCIKKGRTVFIMKGSEKGGIVSNYRSTVCLPIMQKLWTGIIGDEIYGHLEQISLLRKLQKGCCRGSRGTKNHLLIGEAILRNFRNAKRNLAI